MSLKALKAEIKRIAEKMGIDEEMVVLIVLAVVNASTMPMDLPETVGHIVNYRINGLNVSLYFPFCEMNSAEAEEVARAMILHVIDVERPSRPYQVGIMDMQPFPPAGAWQLQRPPEGISLSDYVADQYRQIIEARNEHP
ncbi:MULTISPECIES: hypothetical protein [unclassified Pseudomonas]|uniref:hypothetical protein n=1 Tax=unclassified Pseudomonas TaxID=196821 RepID=UPI000CD10518|nr:MULTISPECIES: hypothetical protein [unclassified Pseudomonas]POA28617.1 hypothetical protein C1887_22600 [Pseudomonas sp. GW456-R21]POA64496.1 hypothetical protein C1884_21040 [Pseudomonas sp. GW460-R15]